MGILKKVFWTEVINSICNTGLLVTAIMSAFLLLKQLRELTDQIKVARNANRLSNLNIVLQLEMMVAQHRSEFQDVLLRITSGDDIQNTSSTLLKERDLKREQYFNVLDRLCACIRRGYLSEGEYKEDYRAQIQEVMERYKDNFSPGTRFRHIPIVHEAWQDGKSALDARVSNKEVLKYE